MSGLVLVLVLASAALHPLREFYIKGDSTPEGVSLAVNIWFGVLAGAHVFVAGLDPWMAFQAWPMMLISGLGLLVFYSCIVATMRSGDLSIYYPITRSSPLFVVVFSFFFLGQSYSPLMLGGIGMVLVGAFLLQYQPGTRLLSEPKILILAFLAMCVHGVITLADAEAMQMVEPAVYMFVMYLFVVPGMAFVLSINRPANRNLFTHLFVCWVKTPFRFAVVGITAYASYYLILITFQLGANVAAISAVRQVSIPFSVLLGCLIYKEARMTARLAWSGLLALGVIVIVLAK